MKNEVTTFLLLISLAIVVVLGVLVVHEKREKIALERNLVEKSSSSSSQSPPPSEKTYTMPAARTYTAREKVFLPKPKTTGRISVESAIAQRRSRRTFTEQPVTMTELSQMLWAGQGITDTKTGKRTIPSARETYPLTLYVVVRNVEGFDAGLYEYLPKEHALGWTDLGNAAQLLTAAGVQDAAQKAPVVFLVAGSYGMSAEKMKATAESSTHMEAGHVGQNLYLEAESLQMGMVVMAGFDSKKVVQSLKIDPAETVLYVIPFGHPAAEEMKE